MSPSNLQVCKRARIALLFLLGGVWLTASSACLNDERVFTQGRIEDLCDSAIPACDSQASCILRGDEFYEGSFPGGLKVITRTEGEDGTLIVRFLLTEMLSPGTELFIEASTPNCADKAIDHPQDVDLFDLAGDDRILEYHVDLPGRGDHLVTIFSDMSARYLMTFTYEEK